MTDQTARGPGRFEGKVVVITGAASGIGRAARFGWPGRAPLSSGWRLSPERLASLAADIAALGGRCETVTGDVSNLATIDAAIARAVEAFGGLDGLVNNAGVGGPMKRFDAVEPAEFDAIVAINLKPVWYGVKAAYRPMRARGGGAIVNVSSMAGLRPNWRHSPYGMTKAGVVSLTQHAAMDYASANIRVNCLCPGPVDTPIFEQMQRNMDAAAYETRAPSGSGPDGR